MFKKSMFSAIQKGLEKKGNSSYSSILRFKPSDQPGKANVYEVRILPFIESPEDTFFEYFTFGWESFSTGQYTGYNSPITFGENDPINNERGRLYRTGTPEEKEKIANVKRGNKRLVNVYVVNDPTDASNNGTVKVMRYGKQLHDIIDNAINGDEEEDIGARAFDLGPEGMTLKVRVTKQGDYPNFTTSKFAPAKELEGMTAARIKEVYGSTVKLSEVLDFKTEDEIQKLWEDHYLCGSTKTVSPDSSGPVTAAPMTSSAAPVTTDTVDAMLSEAQAESSEGAFDLSEEELAKLINQ